MEISNHGGVFMGYTFDDIAGYQTEKEELKRLCEVFTNRTAYLKKGAKLPKGIIFYGEAGTGKTLFANVLADECGLYTYSIDIAEMDSVAQVCRKIKRAFEKAAKHMQPSMIFFDELDKLLPNDEEEYYTDQSKMILAQLLTLIDGMSGTHNFILVATCNNYGGLPETLVRPGRIDKKISIGKPNYESRVEILKFYANNSTCKFEISMEELAKLCSGFTCAALETLINECIIQSDNHNYVSKKLICERILEVKEEDIPRKSSYASDVIRACRNLGYFVVAKSFNNGRYLLNLESDNLGNNFFNKILSEYDSDYNADDFYGDDDEGDIDFDLAAEDREITEYIEENGDDFLHEDEENEYFGKADLLNTICVLCGGYAAQQVVFNKIYDNMQGVLANINAILLNMSSQGMFGFENAFSSWRNGKLPYSYEFIEKLNDLFDKTISDCYAVAEKIVTNNKELIKKMIPVLVEKQFMDNLDCESILTKFGGIIS